MALKLLWGVGLLLAGCVSAKDLRQNGKVHTLGYYTGSMGGSWYDGRFEAGAEKACGGAKYKVLERSATPSTLKDSEGLIESDRFYWVIECV